jgi:hypothetical protein
MILFAFRFLRPQQPPGVVVFVVVVIVVVIFVVVVVTEGWLPIGKQTDGRAAGQKDSQQSGPKCRT